MMKLYKGRIPADPSPLMDRINRSLPFDIRLLPYDLQTNKAWAGELKRLGIFSDSDYADIISVLEDIQSMDARDAFDPLPDDEDVHTLVERLLTERLGETGARIHTGRSRNDQVVCDLRLFTRDRIDHLREVLALLLEVICRRAEEHAETLMAGTTHLQPALPITLGQFLLSLGAAVMRDDQRLRDLRPRVNISPLGSGAMAGSGFTVNRETLAEALGFEGLCPNSVDAVSDRDFCQETVNVCAVLSGHLSRYAEQFVIWANPAFGYVRFADEWSTGSSMMPQKRNPDAMELIRGKAARVFGAQTALHALTKGLPLSYAKDLQEDKEPLFDALDHTELCLRVFTEALGSAQFNVDKLQAALSADMLATDLADALARLGVPFRKAHERVAALVSELEARDLDLGSADTDLLRDRFPEFGDQVPTLDFLQSVKARDVSGGTAPARVREQIETLKAYLREAN